MSTENEIQTTELDSIIKKYISPILAALMATIASGTAYVKSQSDLATTTESQEVVLTRISIKDSIHDSEIQNLNLEVKEIKAMIQKLNDKVLISNVKNRNR